MENYKKLLLEKVSEKEVLEWLKRNPPSEIWELDKYAWAYTEMPVSSFHTWWRKNVLGYKI